MTNVLPDTFEAAQFHTGNSPVKEVAWEVDLLNKTTKIVASESFLQNLNISKNEFDVLKWFSTNLHPEDRERVTQKYHKFLQQQNNTVEEDLYRVYNTSAKKYLWIHSYRKLHRNDEGQPTLVTGFSIDITDTKEVSFELSKQREHYQFLVESLSQVVFTLDTEGNFLFLSNAWTPLAGFEPAYSLGHCIVDYLSTQHAGIFSMKLESLLSGHIKNLDEQLQLVNENGDKVWVKLLAKATLDTNEKVASVFGTIENINEKHFASLLLQESNEKMNAVLNNSKEIILTINLEKKVIENVNEAVSILGYKPCEWIGKNYRTWKDVQRQKFHELTRRAVHSELEVKNHQITFPHKSNDEDIPFEFSTSIFYFKQTKYLLCVLRDIRERVKYEENITRISNQLTHLINNIDDVYAIYDIPSDTYDFVSDNVQTLYDCKKELFSQNSLFWQEVIHAEDRAAVEKEVTDIIAKKGRGDLFYRITTCNGETKMILEKLVVGKDKEDNANKLYIVKTDYTHIENAEQSLLEKEKKFRFISENISDFISIHDTDWNFTYASPSIKNILGYEPHEVLGIGGFELVHPDDLLRTLDEALEPIVLEKKEAQMRCRMRAKDGTYKWVETYSKPVIDSKGETSSIISSTRDVTDQVIAENKLKESEEQYRLLSENSNDVIAIYNLNGEFSYVSPSCRQVLGYEPEELLGKRPLAFISRTKEEAKLAEAEIDRLVFTKSTGKIIHKINTKSGEERTLEIWIKPIFKGGNLSCIQAASRDVTEREKLLVDLEESLAKERELNELRSKFVSTASHQFRTPLTVIQSGVELMEMYIEDLPEIKQEKFQRQFKKIQSEVERLQDLMNDVLVLGRANAARTPFNPKKSDLVSFCKEIIENKYNNRYPASRSIILNITGKPLLADFDSKLLAHAIENILCNAYKYSEKGNITFDLHFSKSEVTLNITDEGMGISEEDIKNLFQPFHRGTNALEIDGTGLGLVIVKEFIEKHNGKIILTSKLNKGTTVSVILPIKQI